MRRLMVAGNWKMNGTRASVAELLKGLKSQEFSATVEVAIFPTFLHVSEAVEALREADIAVGAQDVATQSGPGALTGEVAASQLVDAGCSLVLIGHSERRQVLGEAESVLVAKFKAAQEAGLVPVLCVGETLEDREAGRTFDFVGGQLDSIMDAVGVEVFARAVIAYEPVWAIGTGLTATPEQAQEVHKAIRARLAARNAEVAQGVRLLYGGSVKAANAAELFRMPDIDGGLIGGAALNADEFGAICRAAGS
jgi:triosephosphate isomerase